MNDNFSGKVVIVTGAASGFGAATAIEFSKTQALLALVDKDAVNLTKIGVNCRKNSTREPLLIEANLSKEEDIQMVIDKVINQFGKINVLINCAGILQVGSIDSASLQQFDTVFNTNVRGVFELTRLAVPHLIESKGNIINFSSIVATKPNTLFLVYAMSKAAIQHFTKILALELAPKQVRVNCVNPGTVVTNIFKNAGMNDQQIDRLMEIAKPLHPIGRFGETTDVTNAILFLASDKASFITGAHLPIDGGFSVS